MIKLKKILYLFLSIVLIFIIYLKYSNLEYNYVSIGDELILSNNFNKTYNDYIKDYLIKNNKLKNFNNYFYNNTIIGLINDIKNNRTIRKSNKEYFFKKVLRESDYLIISIGMEKIIKNYDKYDMNKNYRYFNKMYNDIENLIIEINKYTKGKIIFLGYYNPTNYYDSKTDELFYDLDIRLNELLENNNIIYISLYDLVKGNQYRNELGLLNTYGNKNISNIIEYYLE